MNPKLQRESGNESLEFRTLCRPERPDRRECCYQRPQSGREHEDAGCSNNRRLIGNEGGGGRGGGVVSGVPESQAETAGRTWCQLE